MNIDNKKEFISFLRTRTNHILVLVITIGAGVTKLFIDNTLTQWFWIGLFVIVVMLIAYIIISIIEIKEINKLKKDIK